MWVRTWDVVLCALLALVMAGGGFGWLLWSQSPGPASGAPEGEGAAHQRSARVRELELAMEALRPLHSKLGPPQPGDWLSVHPEPGQTFRQYLRSDPVTPRGGRRVVYVQLLGEVSEAQHRIITLAADFMGRCYSVPVAVKEELPLSLIPERARRVHWGSQQILTTYVIDRVLRPRLPDDAAAYVAFTAADLWPGEGWNFVFGQASLRDRVGVWSISRFGDPGESQESFRLCLLRTMKTGVHELGHMFGMYHCTAYQCGMCGSNSLPESDRRPLAFCPECMAKVCWAAGAAPVERYKKLAAFCTQHGLTKEADFYHRSITVLTQTGSGE